MRTGGVRYGIQLDTLSYILHHIVGKVRHKTNACGGHYKAKKPWFADRKMFTLIQKNLNFFQWQNTGHVQICIDKNDTT